MKEIAKMSIYTDDSFIKKVIKRCEYNDISYES